MKPLFISQHAIRTMFHICRPARGDSSRFGLSCVQLTIEKHTVRVIACDNAAAHITEIPCDNAAAINASDTNENDVPQFSTSAESVSILVPKDASDKIAGLKPLPGFACMIELKRENGKTVCSLTYKDGRDKIRVLCFECSELRFPDYRNFAFNFSDPSGWIESPAGHLSEMLTPPTWTKISLNGHAIAQGFRRDMEDLNLQPISKKQKPKNERDFRYGGEIETAIDGNRAAAFLDVIPSGNETRLNIFDSDSAIHIRSKIGEVSALAVIMPLSECR